jgi:hypothetical protein
MGGSSNGGGGGRSAPQEWLKNRERLAIREASMVLSASICTKHHAELSRST